MTETDDGFIIAGLPPGTGEVLPENLGIHTSLPTQVGVVKTPRWRWCQPINSLTNARTIEFQISSQLSELIDPSRTYLHLICRFEDANGQAIPAEVQQQAPAPPAQGQAAGGAGAQGQGAGGAAAAPVMIENPAARLIPANGLSYNLFKSCEVRLNDQPIASGDNMYAYRGDMETRLMWPQSIKKGMMKMTGFDEEEHAFETIGQGDVPDFGGNAAWQNGTGEHHQALKRRLMRSKGREFACLGRIHSEIFDQSRLLPPYSKLHVTFHRTDFDAFSILSNQNNPVKIKIVKAELLVMYMPIDEDVVTEMVEETRKGHNTIIPLRRVEMNYYTKLNNTTDFSHPNLFHDGETLPRRIFIAFVDSGAFRGRLDRDPFNYRDVGIAHYALRIGGEHAPYPEIHVRPDDNTMQIFTLLDATGAAFEDELGIDVDNYRKRNNILGFDLTNSKTRAGSSYELPCTKSCDLELTLHNPLEHPVTMIVYAEYDAELEINSFGQVKKKQFGSAA